MLKVYKGCRNGMVVTLEIDPKDLNNMGRSHVVDPNHAKYRCQSARVVGIEHVLTGETPEKATSGYDDQFCYRVGDLIEVPEYSTEIECVCGHGIHFYLTKEIAVFHALQLIDFEGYTGEWMQWYDNGQRLDHAWLKDGEWDGECEEWHENGQRSAHGWYKDGKWDGEWEAWYASGKRSFHGWYK